MPILLTFRCKKCHGDYRTKVQGVSDIWRETYNRERVCVPCQIRFKMGNVESAVIPVLIPRETESAVIHG